MIKELSKLLIWEKILAKASDEVGAPLSLVDKNGNKLLSFGREPFLCEIIHNKLPSNCQLDGCLAKLKILRESLHIQGEHVGYITLGPLRHEEPVPDYTELNTFEQEELTEEYRKMSVRPITDELRTFLKALTRMMEEVGVITLQYKEKVADLELYQKIMHMMNPSNPFSAIIKNLLIFFMEFCNAKNVAVSLFDTGKIFTHHPTDLDLEAIEKEVHSNVRNNHHPFSMSSLSALFPDKESTYAITGLPLMIEDVLAGVIIIFTPENTTPSPKEIGILKKAAHHISNGLTIMKQFENVHVSAITDKLTGTYNRAYFNAKIEEVLDEHQKNKTPISVMMLDIDNFKFFNDNYGHIKGDEVLKKISDILKDGSRKSDILCRFGGEEFIIILPNTKMDNAQVVAERIRKDIEAREFSGVESQKKVTMSIGVATCLNSSLKSFELLKEADNALYKAKNTGKNKVVCTVVVDRNMAPVDVNAADELYVHKKKQSEEENN